MMDKGTFSYLFFKQSVTLNHDENIFFNILSILETFSRKLFLIIFLVNLNEWFFYFQYDNDRQFIRNFLKIPYYLSEKYDEKSPVFPDSKDTTYKELLKHVLRKRNVYDTITGSRDLTSSHAASGIHQTIQRLRQLQRLENKHRRFLHGAPLSIGLALPVLSRNINVPVSTSTK